MIETPEALQELEAELGIEQAAGYVDCRPV